MNRVYMFYLQGNSLIVSVTLQAHLVLLPSPFPKLKINYVKAIYYNYMEGYIIKKAHVYSLLHNL